MPPLPHPPTIGSLVWHLSLRWRAAVDRAVLPLGLTHAQYSALASLRALSAAGERPSQRRLAAYTGLGPIYTSKLVRVLERTGMLAREPDPADARAVRLSLTASGRDVIDRAVPIVRALNDELLRPVGGIDSPAAGAFAQTLRTLLQAAPEPDPHPEPPHQEPHPEPPHQEPPHPEPPHPEPPHQEPPHPEPPHQEPPHQEPPHPEPQHQEPPHQQPPPGGPS